MKKQFVLLLILQPPHQHANEEFQYVIEGSGTGFLNGKETPIQKGDLMYAKPRALHGISNTGTDTLKFFVMKWINKGIPKPVQAKNKKISDRLLSLGLKI